MKVRFEILVREFGEKSNTRKNTKKKQNNGPERSIKA